MIVMSAYYIPVAFFLVVFLAMLLILLILNTVAAHFGVKEVRIQVFREVREAKSTSTPSTPPRRESEVE